MNARAFFDLVANMRAAQIGFFKSPKGSQERQGYYKQSKDLEAAVDAEIQRVNNILNKQAL